MARGSVTRMVSPVTGKVSWRARHSYIDDAGRRRHRSKSHPTRKDAEAWNARAQHQLRSGSYVEPSTMTLAVFAERWFTQAASRLRSSTLHRYRQDWKLYIGPALGDLPISRIRPSHVQDLYDALTARGLAAFTVTGVHRVLTGMMKSAIADGLIAANPCTGRTLPKPQRDTVRFWTLAQLRTFLDATAETSMGPLWAFLAYTGVRIGEALALQWTDIDLERRTASIHRTVRMDATGRRVASEGTKTRSSNRTISLPAMAIMALQRQRARIAELQRAHPRVWRDEGLVFPNAHGGVIPSGNATATFAYYVKRLDVPRLSPHGLRHTAASLMFQQGVHPKVAQEQLGHASIAITMDLYSHLTESMRRSAADAIDALLEATLTDTADTTTSREN